MYLWKFYVWAAGKGHKPQAVGHIVELCPLTNLMVGVYLAAAFFLNNYKAFFSSQTVLAIQFTDTFTWSSSGTLNGQKAVAPIYR